MPMITHDEVKSRYTYDPDTGAFENRKTGKVIEYVSPSDGYLRLNRQRIDGHGYLVHRLIWLYVYGRWPVDQIDHINGIRHDNRLSNLREVDHSTNHRNCKLRSDNSSGYNGVRWKPEKRKWQAYINPGRWTHIGYYATFEEAVVARKQAEKEHGFHKNHGRKVA